MRITEVRENKKRYLDLLLLGDEQEDMIDRYLDRGTMYLLEDGGPVAQCVVTDEGNGVLEIKNLAVAPQRQGHGILSDELLPDDLPLMLGLVQPGQLPVSYTHLDVYKRQGIQRANKELRASPCLPDRILCLWLQDP